MKLIRIKLLLLVVFLAVPLIVSAESPAYKPVAAKTDKTPAWPFSNFNFIIPWNDSQYTISSTGRVEYQEQKSEKFALYDYKENYFYILSLHYAKYKDDLLIIYNVSNEESSGGQITRITNTRAFAWNISIPASIHQSVIEGTYIYLVDSSGRFISRVDLDDGKFGWQRKDLRGKFQIDSVRNIDIHDTAVELMYLQKSMGQSKEITLKLAKDSGQER